MADGLQVLIPCSPAIVAGLPPAVRSAHRAASELACAKIVFCGQDEHFASRFQRQLTGLGTVETACANGEPASALLRPGAPLLILAGAGFPEPQGLKDFIARAQSAEAPVRWLSGGRCAATYYPDAAAALQGAETSSALARRAEESGQPGKQSYGLPESDGQPAEAPGWVSVCDDAGALRAERALFAQLPKDTDGYLARFDRRWSMAITSMLLPLPVTPNHITTASLALGLLGAWWLASGSYALTLTGALLLWFCCLLDGCDGEVARLKLLCSPSGAAYDLAADHVAHLATFIAIPLGVHRMRPTATLALPGTLLVTGFLASMLAVWYLVLRKPESERGPYALFIERVASRDYVYLIVLLAAIGRLDWFLYAAGLGSHLFWLALLMLPLLPKKPLTQACPKRAALTP